MNIINTKLTTANISLHLFTSICWISFHIHYPATNFSCFFYEVIRCLIYSNEIFLIVKNKWKSCGRIQKIVRSCICCLTMQNQKRSNLKRAVTRCYTDPIHCISKMQNQSVRNSFYGFAEQGSLSFKDDKRNYWNLGNRPGITWKGTKALAKVPLISIGSALSLQIKNGLALSKDEIPAGLLRSKWVWL